MKKLLSVLAILTLAGSLLPAKGQAGLRGAFDPITNGDALFKGHFQPVLRAQPWSGSGTAASPRVERWLYFITHSAVVGSESVGEIWQQRNSSQAALVGFGEPVPVLHDAAGIVSYVDPAWSADGKWLAYVQTDNFITQSSIYVQQYNVSTNKSVAATPLGSPILVADGTGGLHHRHPAWSPSGTQIAYDSDASGLSIDLWSVDVVLDATTHTGTVTESSRHRRTTLDNKAEFKPAYKPDGSQLAFVTNLYGPFTIQILDLSDDTFSPAEVNPTLITHDNPAWSSDGASIYYDAPASEDATNPQDIWKLDLATGAKCAIHIDLAGDVDPDVSRLTSVTSDGIPFNFVVFLSQAAGMGLQIWRGEYVQNCVDPLPMNVEVSPATINLDNSQASAKIEATLSFPQGTINAGYQCQSFNGPREGVRMRRSIIPSPTMAGLRMRSTPGQGNCLDMGFGIPLCYDVLYVYVGNVGDYSNVVAADGTLQLIARYSRRTIAARLVALGLVNQTVPIRMDAYSNRIGRTFLGYGYLGISSNSLAGSIVRLEQNYPNPFNPQTKISFAVSKPGAVDVRVFNVRGELVRTITNQWYPQGEHTVAWDGKGDNGRRSSSGVYYIRAKVAGGDSDVIKAVLAQ